MRLIDTSTLILQEFYPPNIPRYAILSHTWGPAEVTFKDFQTSRGKSKAGFRKIMNMVKLARQLKHKYIWVDTCCIDKSDSNELTEAINSMYLWYREAAVCVAFLEDAPRGCENKILFQSRWFTRGWTLQELVAPRHVYFYDADWVCRGHKMTLEDGIFKRTNIPRRILRGEAKNSEYSLARRMSWAAGRETTRIEDMAYCLLGIFDVSMPLLYGEGHKAFRRLQEEIVKKNSDLTIFAWRSPLQNVPTIQVTSATAASPAHPSATTPVPVVVESSPASRSGSSNAGHMSPVSSRTTSPAGTPSGEEKRRSASPSGNSSMLIPPQTHRLVSSPKSSSLSVASSTNGSGSKTHPRTELCLFAPSPEPFAEFASLHPFADDFENFTVTNRGLLVSGSVYLRLAHRPSPDGKTPARSHYLMLVGSQFGSFVGIYLIKIGPNMFQRDWDVDMAVLKQEDVLLMRGSLVMDWYILIDKRPANTITPEIFRQSSIHIPAEGYGNKYVMIKETTPMHLWDVQDRLFVRPKAYEWTRYDMVLAVKCAVALRDVNIKVPDTPDAILIAKRVTFVVLCQYRFHQRDPQFVVFLEVDYPRETDMIMVRRAPNNSFMWPDLDIMCPHLTTLPDHVMVDVGERSPRTGRQRSCWYRISVVCKKEKVDLEYSEPELYSVYFDIKLVENYDPGAQSNGKTEKKLVVGRNKPS